MYRSESRLRNDQAGHSPHYFIFENRKYPDARSSRSDRCEHGRLVHLALKFIAGYDSDHAHFANGKASLTYADKKVLRTLSFLIASTLPSQKLPVTVVDGSLVAKISVSSSHHFEPS